MTSLLVILLSISLASGFDHFKRCLLFNKTCVLYCPKYMHPYHTRCDRDTMSQRTCDEPINFPIGYTCGWSRCDCNGDLLLDLTTQVCVSMEDCPVVTHRKPPHERVDKARRRNKHRSAKIIVPPDVDLIDLKDTI